MYKLTKNRIGCRERTRVQNGKGNITHENILITDWKNDVKKQTNMAGEMDQSKNQTQNQKCKKQTTK